MSTLLLAGLCLALLSSCDSRSDSNAATSSLVTNTELSADVPANSPANEGATPNQTIFSDWVTYQDSNLLLKHPPELVVQTPADGESIQFLAPELNQLGGYDNCGLLFFYQAESSLANQTLVAESALYKTSPEPQTEFLEINDEPAARISGNLDLDATVPIPGRTQIMHKQDFTYLITCVGFTPEIIDGIFDSFVIL